MFTIFRYSGEGHDVVTPPERDAHSFNWECGKNNPGPIPYARLQVTPFSLNVKLFS
jgi:hypothetical protein